MNDLIEALTLWTLCAVSVGALGKAFYLIKDNVKEGESVAEVSPGIEDLFKNGVEV